MASYTVYAFNDRIVMALLVVIFAVIIGISFSITNMRKEALLAQDIDSKIASNTSNPSEYTAVVSIQGENYNVGRIVYDFEEGKTVASCEPKCQRSSGKLVTFSYMYPDIVSGTHQRGRKTCFCDPSKIMDKPLTITAMNDGVFEEYVKYGGNDATGYVNNILKAHGHNYST